MAMIYCSECGKEISDQAKFCIHCGFPIQDIKNAEIDRQNREYYKKFNVWQLFINLVAFGISFYIGYIGLNGDVKLWAWAIFIICFALILFLSFKWIPCLFIALSFATQKYKHIPHWMIIITICFGYVLGGITGLKAG